MKSSQFRNSLGPAPRRALLKSQ